MNSPIPNPEIRALLALVDQFPQRKRVQYHDNDDLRFVSAILLALRAAEPEIRRLALKLCTDWSSIEATNPSPSPETVSMPNSVERREPILAPSIHIPRAILNTADTDAAFDPESDTAGKPASVSASVPVLPAKPPTRPKAAHRATALAQPRTRPAVPPPALPATLPTEPA